LLSRNVVSRRELVNLGTVTHLCKHLEALLSQQRDVQGGHVLKDMEFVLCAIWLFCFEPSASATVCSNIELLVAVFQLAAAKYTSHPVLCYLLISVLWVADSVNSAASATADTRIRVLYSSLIDQLVRIAQDLHADVSFRMQACCLIQHCLFGAELTLFTEVISVEAAPSPQPGECFEGGRAVAGFISVLQSLALTGQANLMEAALTTGLDVGDGQAALSVLNYSMSVLTVLSGIPKKRTMLLKAPLSLNFTYFNTQVGKLYSKLAGASHPVAVAAAQAAAISAVAAAAGAAAEVNAWASVEQAHAKRARPAYLVEDRVKFGVGKTGKVLENHSHVQVAVPAEDAKRMAKEFPLIFAANKEHKAPKNCDYHRRAVETAPVLIVRIALDMVSTFTTVEFWQSFRVVHALVSRAMHILVNITAEPVAQKFIGSQQHSISMLVALAQAQSRFTGRDSGQISAFASAIIANLSKHSANRTRLFKMELHLQHKALQQESEFRIPRPPKAGPDNKRFSRTHGSKEPGSPRTALPSLPIVDLVQKHRHNSLRKAHFKEAPELPSLFENQGSMKKNKTKGGHVKGHLTGSMGLVRRGVVQKEMDKVAKIGNRFSRGQTPGDGLSPRWAPEIKSIVPVPPGKHKKAATQVVVGVARQFKFQKRGREIVSPGEITSPENSLTKQVCNSCRFS
jgi:hypothetical protein